MTTVYDNTPGVHMSEFCDDSGFPFDDTEDRGLRSRQRLDELAQRHPELAEHLNSDTWGRARTSSSGATDDPFARFRNRSRFQDFGGFPFDDFDDPRQFERFYQSHDPAQQSAPQQPHPNTQPQPAPQQTAAQPPQQPQQQPQTTSASVTTKPPAAPESGKKIQQSNTVDLGQPQAPLVDETRTHRSMSAPPEHPNRAGGKRYVYSVNIPNVNADMGVSASQPQQQGPPPAQPEPTHGTPKERIIPIHVEGRDEVVTPSASAQAQQHPPQSERIFGQRPNIFTQYVNPQDQPQEDLRHQEELRRQQQQQKYQDYMRQQQQQQQQQQQPQPSEAPHPPPPKTKPTSLDLIQNIQKDVSELMTQVENFEGMPRDKKYLYLDEMLTRKMLLLDDIETGGQDAIRKARKEAIKCIQDTIKVLENKAQANEDALKRPAKEATPTPTPTPVETSDVAVQATPAPETTPADNSAPPDTQVPQPEEPSANTTREKTPENQELVVGGVARSGSQVTAMDVESAAATAEAQPPPPTEDQKTDETKEGATEKKRVKKKAEKK